MNSRLLAILTIVGSPALFMGCATTSQPAESGVETVTLSGNKFDGGDRVRRTITFAGTKGRLNLERDSGSETARIDFRRDQVFDEYEPVYSDGRKVSTRYYVSDDFSWATVRSGNEIQFESFNTSPLRGYVMEGTLDPGSGWRYSLGYRRPDDLQAAALKEVIYHTKSNYPGTPMKVGAKWSHSPLFINAYLRRDVKNVIGQAQFELKEVRTLDGEKVAIIGVELESNGDEVLADSSVVSASISLRGEITLSLETYLETSISLSGEMTGSISIAGQSHLYTSPITVAAYESYLEEDRIGP